MEGVHITTSQNVTIDYNLADIGTRVLARILDAIFMAVYGVIFYMIFFGVLATGKDETFRFLFENDGALLILFGFLISLPIICYSLWAPYFMQGQTFGKKILQIKIVRMNGEEASFGTYFVRWLLNVVDSLFYNILGLIVMASNNKRQRVADLVAKTVVISTKQQLHVDQTILSQIEDVYQPKFSQVLRLSDRDAQIINSSMVRARMSRDINLVKKLRSKIEQVIQEYKPEMSDVEYVETVLKDYQYFSQQ